METTRKVLEQEEMTDEEIVALERAIKRAQKVVDTLQWAYQRQTGKRYRWLS